MFKLMMIDVLRYTKQIYGSGSYHSGVSARALQSIVMNIQTNGFLRQHVIKLRTRANELPKGGYISFPIKKSRSFD